jgi:hypothetical protein
VPTCCSTAKGDQGRAVALTLGGGQRLRSSGLVDVEGAILGFPQDDVVAVYFQLDVVPRLVAQCTCIAMCMSEQTKFRASMHARVTTWTQSTNVNARSLLSPLAGELGNSIKLLESPTWPSIRS